MTCFWSAVPADYWALVGADANADAGAVGMVAWAIHLDAAPWHAPKNRKVKRKSFTN